MIARLRNVRTRLTLWYLAVLASVMILYVAGTSAFLFWILRAELDQGLRDQIEAFEGELSLAPDGTLQLGPSLRDEGHPEEGPQAFLDVRAPDGTVLYRNEILGGAPEPGEGKDSYSERSSRLPDGTRIRMASRLHRIGDRTILIRLARSEEPFRHKFQQWFSVMLLGLPAALGIAGLGGYALARRVLAPIDTMARRAEQITADRLHERLPVENAGDELGHLARVFNDTLARLERSFEQLQRFTADASHELRTPLTALRSVGEVGLQKDGNAPYYRDIIGSMLEEANRLTRLVDHLLVIARADAGQTQLRRTKVPLLDLAREAAALLEVLADEKAQRLTVEGDETVTAMVDPLILREALVNLIDNGIKYSPVNGRIAVGVRRSGASEPLIEISDTGPGIGAEHRAKVFERFYRVDKARAREAGGAGLGLSIARWAVEANGGSIELESERDQGCTFRIKLPAAQTRPAAARVG